MNDFNIGSIMEVINDKMDRNAHNTQTPSAVVIASQMPTAENNYTWYRKYSDGWVEQGGAYTTTSGGGQYANYTVTLPIIMSNTNYTILVSCGYPGNGDTSVTVKVNQSNKTTSGFSIVKNWSNANVSYYWEVKGISA